MKTYSMEEEIKQKLELGFNPKYAGATNDLLDLISQVLQKRDEQWLEHNTRHLLLESNTYDTTLSPELIKNLTTFQL